MSDTPDRRRISGETMCSGERRLEERSSADDHQEGSNQRGNHALSTIGARDGSRLWLTGRSPDGRGDGSR